MDPADVIDAVHVAVAVVEGLIRALKEANSRLATNTGKYNKRLSNSLDAFLIRVYGECIEGRMPSERWNRDLEQLRDDVNAHAITVDRHTTESRPLALFKSIADNTRAKNLLEDVERLRLSMDFTAAAADTPTSS